MEWYGIVAFCFLMFCLVGIVMFGANTDKLFIDKKIINNSVKAKKLERGQVIVFSNQDNVNKPQDVKTIKGFVVVVDKLMKNVKKSLGNFCQELQTTQIYNNIDCGSLDSSNALLERSMIPLLLHYDNESSLDYCNSLDNVLWYIGKDLYIHEDDLTHLSESEFQKHIAELMLKENNLHSSYFDSMYKVVKSYDELYVFLSDEFMLKCK